MPPAMIHDRMRWAVTVCQYNTKADRPPNIAKQVNEIDLSKKLPWCDWWEKVRFLNMLTPQRAFPLGGLFCGK